MSGSGSSSGPAGRLAAAWKEMDLGSFKNKLDASAETLATEESDRRGLLIERLEDFRRRNSEEVCQATAPLIQTFQEEIDRLTQRNDAAERAFLEAYEVVTRLEDPTAILEQAQEKILDLRSKIHGLEIELNETEDKVRDYDALKASEKSQAKELQKVQNLLAKYNKNIDETLNERMVEVTEKLTQEADERIRIAEEEKVESRRKVNDLKDKLEKQRLRLEAAETELFELNQQNQEKNEARVQEQEILLADVESWQSRALAAEKELQELSTMSNTAQHDLDVSLRDELEDAERRVQAKEREIERLVDQMNALSEDKAALEIETSNKLEGINEALKDARRRLTISEEALERQKDYETIKKELMILKSLEEQDQTPESGSKPVEVMILQRSKQLQSENTYLRNQKDALTKSLDEAKEDVSAKSQEMLKQRKLIDELEANIEQLQKIRHPSPGVDADQTVISVEGNSLSVDLLKDLDMLVTSAAGAQEGDVSSFRKDLLPIVQAQRERLKLRNDELEEEKGEVEERLKLVQGEAAQLRTDNVKLYEKIRFLQGYEGQKVARNQSVALDMSKYKSQYEQRLDPFTNFSQQERQRHVKNLNIVEKMILWMVRFMMSNKLARILIFCYFIFLHMLVFVVLMRMAYSESHARQVAEAVEWRQKFDEHMRNHHPAESVIG